MHNPFSPQCNSIPVSSKLSSNLYRIARYRSRPCYCMIELTCFCNFSCSICGYRLNENQIAEYGIIHTAREWQEVINQLYKAGVLEVTLTGGEPLTYPYFKEVYEQLSVMGFKVILKTNASLVCYHEELFKKYPPSYCFVSMYGGSEDTYHRVTSFNDGYHSVINGITFLHKMKVPVKLSFIASKESVYDFPLVCDLCCDLGFSLGLLTDVYPNVYGLNSDSILSKRLSPAERVCVSANSPYDVEYAMHTAKRLEKYLECIDRKRKIIKRLNPENGVG